ncbi:MAG TPA: hypothetical protein PLZ52_09490 [Bacteroidales bacterium]|nr:hypothetical protein [Bacteroidales bacterium]HQL70124.1 hypothetical protein [Bacteroidales bacterium]
MKTLKQTGLLLGAVLLLACSGNRKPEVNIDDTGGKQPGKKPVPQTDTVVNSEPEVFEDVIYTQYVNERFHFSVYYPDFLIPQGESMNGDGQKFLAADSSAFMLAYGVLNLSETLQQDFELATTDNQYYESGFEITYKTFGETWYVINGIHGQNMFYVHAVMNGSEVINVYFEYPLSEKQKYETLIKQVVASLVFTHKNHEV